MQPPLLFDAVLFDLDGTLVATDRFWIQAARTGARRAFEELELERELPSRDEWLGLIGHGLEEGFRTLFRDLGEGAWRHVLARCQEEENRLLATGGAVLMPGAREVLTELTVQGARLGIASNCARDYLDHMLVELGLADTVHDAYCLDSVGITDKADMLFQLLRTFGTRSAVMIGDRAGDRNASWANGLPHVHCAFGFAGETESVEAEASIEDLGELQGVLARRGRWIEGTLRKIGLAFDGRGPMVVGITGGLASGKSLFARDAARLLRAHGQPAVAVSLEGFRQRSGTRARSAGGPEAIYDLERLEREVLAPHQAGAPLRLPPEAGLDGNEGRVVPEDAVLLLEGPFLLDPRLQRHLDRALYLEVPDEILWRRLQGREGREQSLDALELVRGERLPSLAAHRERYDPGRLADLVLDGSNPLGPDGSPWQCPESST